jgi:hypothetical protein
MFIQFAPSAIVGTLLNLARQALSTHTLLTLLVALALATTAQADIVGTPTISGPGGTGVIGPNGGTLTEPALNYTSLAPLDVTITVDSAARYYVSETTSFAGITGVENNTGVSWSGFTWQLISEVPGSLVYDPNSPNFSGIDFFFPAYFANATGTPTLATFSGGTLPSGSFFEPAFKIDFPSAGTYVVRETPIAVPEPSGLILLALGAATAMLWRLRR